jgi:hypothetical protein
MQITDHEKTEWSRYADACREKGYVNRAKYIADTIACGTLALINFDEIAALYRRWLVFGEF